MINNISSVDTHLQQMSVAKTMTSTVGMSMPPILGFKTFQLKQKANLRVKKFKRSDEIIIAGEIDDDYVDIIEEDIEEPVAPLTKGFSFVSPVINKQKIKYLKDCYVIDYIQSPQARCGMGTEALKGLAEKALFDSKIQGRIVTYSAPVWQESSPALFFYKLGFRFMDPAANERMKECLIKKIPDLPPQVGMMYLPKIYLNKLLHYGEMF
ncbi:MAG: hypothetical protein MJ230_03185 [bacterium]|nr:hypothetical protein [bacterium]